MFSHQADERPLVLVRLYVEEIEAVGGCGGEARKVVEEVMRGAEEDYQGTRRRKGEGKNFYK